MVFGMKKKFSSNHPTLNVKTGTGESGSRKKRKKGGFNDEKYLRMAKRQRERRQWEDRRAQILRTYEESSFFSCSSAEIVYELSWLLSKDTNNLLWLAIIGLTDQYLLNRVSKSGTMYLNERDFLGSHVRRLNNLMGSDSESILSVDYMKISAERQGCYLLTMVYSNSYGLIEQISN